MSTPHGQVVTHLTEGQTKSGAALAAKHLNQMNANAQYDKPTPTIVGAPKPTSVQSLHKSAQELSTFSTWWNTMCDQFQWEATTPKIASNEGGKRKTRKSKKGKSKSKRNSTTQVRAKSGRNSGLTRRVNRK